MRVALVTKAGDAEGETAARWLTGQGVPFTPIGWESWRHVDALGEGVIWVHGAAIEWDGASAPALRALRAAVERGRSALFTLGAALLPHAMGGESRTPIVARGLWSDEHDPLWDEDFRDWPDYPHIRGIQGWATGSHPLYDGLMGGTFTWRASANESWLTVGYDAPAWPAGRVVGVERAYVTLNAGRAVAWEHDVGEGHVLSVGAHVALTSPDVMLSPQRDRLLLNALRYVAHLDAGRARPSEPAAASWFWPRPGVATMSAFDLAARRDSPRRTGSEGAPSSELSLEGPAETGAQFTLAGERAFVSGTEDGGLSEVWTLPLALLTGGVELRLDGESPRAARFRAAPEGLTRELVAGRARVVEEILPSIDEPAVLVRYTAIGDDAPGFALAFSPRLRLQWPYDAGALHPLATRVDALEGGGWLVRVDGCDGMHAAGFLIDGAAAVTVSSGDAPVVHVAAPSLRQLQLIAIGCATGADDLQRAVRATVARGFAGAQLARHRRFAQLRDATTRLVSGDARLDIAFEWAKARLAMFMASAPRGGRGVLAGYGLTRPGWGVSRPGYAWFFGRDACWSADALLAAGMFEDARDILRFLADSRDVTGKIIHEYTASGVAHYDAADATPLFLRLAATYGEWTGDDQTLRALWPAIRQSAAYVASTDRDGDGLPENTGVGHGWLEMAPLGGGRVTSYVAAIWIDALARLARTARWLGDEAFAEWCEQTGARARAGFEARLRDPVTGRCGLQLSADGTLHAELTALSAVPIALGVDTGPAADDALHALGGERFCAAWGVRLLAADDARYRPAGYHSGAVWPLYTGWLALAAFERLHGALGARLLRKNAELCFRRARGAFDEVLNGDSGAAVGVCPDQAWSAAMVVAPAIAGLWGVRADAARRTLRLRPQLSEESASLGRLRIGAARLDIEVGAETSTPDGRRRRVRWRLEGTAIDITLEVVRRADEDVVVLSQGRVLDPADAGASAGTIVTVALGIPVGDLEIVRRPLGRTM